MKTALFAKILAINALSVLLVLIEFTIINA